MFAEVRPEIWHADASWPPSELVTFFHGMLIFLVVIMSVVAKWYHSY